MADVTFDPAGYGAVAYAYQIGKYEVTNAQYADFLNAADPTGANANGIYNGPADESSSVGFRVASVPEPTSLVLTMLASVVMFARRKR